VTTGPVSVSLVEVTADNWRSVARVRATEDQLAWVADVTYYLCLCTYGDTWHPWLIEAAGVVVGYLMGAVDDDASRWLGGFVVDAAHQRRGYGRAAVAEAVRILSAQPGCTGIALSVSPDNEVARAFYRGMGFEETGETDDDELVMRRGLG
jgi:diamine N-acetyltransferase